MASPTSVGPGTTAEDLQTAAQVVEMLLIRDHSRMKLEAVTSYDSTHDQQFRLLPISHPEDWLRVRGVQKRRPGLKRNFAAQGGRHQDAPRG